MFQQNVKPKAWHSHDIPSTVGYLAMGMVVWLWVLLPGLPVDPHHRDPGGIQVVFTQHH